MSDVKGSRFGFGAVQACRAASVLAKNGCSLAVPLSAEMLTTTPSSAASQSRAARRWPLMVAAVRVSALVLENFVGDGVNKEPGRLWIDRALGRFAR